MTSTYPKPYQRGKTWYFKVTNKDHKRVQVRIGQVKKKDAQEFIIHYVNNLEYMASDSAPVRVKTLRDLLTLYTDPNTNPRFRDKQATGQNYGARYANHVMRDAGYVLAMHLPILDKELYKISRRDMKDAALQIVKAFGRSQKSKNMYKIMKVSLSQAADDGLIQVSPSQGLPDIKPEIRKPRFALPFSEIKQVIDEDLFPDEYTRHCFIILVTTGLRRSEFLALIPSQVQGDALVVNRAYKDDKMTIVGPPKWDLIRTIALPEITKGSFRAIFREDPYITVRQNGLAKSLKQVGAYAAHINPMWEGLTPHILRHSLATALRLSGLPEILVREYMSWEHQKDIQDAYTHAQARHLKPVAEHIDRLCNGEVQEGRVVQLG